MIIAIFALAKLVVQLAAASGYGYFRDELYYLACSDHLAFGYVDHPPLSILPLWLVRHLFGTSLLALRFVPALAGSATVALVGLIARRMGGGRLAQALAMTGALMAGEYLALDHYYSMNALDILFWTLGAYLLVRLLDGGPPRLWLLLGVVLGLGLENKLSVLWLGAGLAVGLLLGPERRWLATRWPWLAGAIAAALLAPHVLWQIDHGWPTLEFIHNATTEKMARVSWGAFVHGQIDTLNPFSLPIWGAGLVALLALARLRRFRLLAWIYLVVFALLISNGTSRASYLGPTYTWLFAAGGVFWEGLAQRWRLPRLAAALVVLLLVIGALLSPFALPVLPLPVYVRYAAALGVVPQTEERKELAALPNFYADMRGWPEIAATLEAAWRAVPAAERARARILAPDYGVAAAVDFFAVPHGVPHALSGHNNYWLWGPDGYDGGPLIVAGGRREQLLTRFGSVEQVATLECGDCMPYENHRPVWLCRELRLTVPAYWQAIKHYD